ncbi:MULTISPECIES: hypothetical protein [unclassified Methanoculleus]|uniref:hypothetical protein n=1 Tax=unclassified Methanoculleus TaxID=2619537 RepID=UPI0025F907D8|nr:MULTISPECIES: hypothetical protein [unclassified Methanoculleus]MCK9318819.1 hypothetical protein [Methanoculleus sp.]MDD2788998.1 hypothetical protein [Methanoculleus sp.]MDD3217512.1 hypothetical protein [Methanoculleus sp.]MDD4313638.1 hypothetical protein [Methanoculleus sp.]MDD4472125.1 hypothetical protein [Methanoculleus sp.]
MKRIAWLTLIAAMMLVSTASAAYVSISAPQTVYVGDTLEITGTTVVKGLPKPTLNPGFSTEVILYYAQHAKSEVGRTMIVVQEDGSFFTEFETEGLKAGRYSIEIVDPTQTTFGSSSKVRQEVNLVDRAGTLTISSPRNQDFDGSLDIRGMVADIEGAGVQIEVKHDGATVYGPKYIHTGNDGAFSAEVSVSVSGSYEVIFSDTEGYIDTVEFIVVGAPAPTPTQAMISASAPATRSAPAYFEVDTGSGVVMIATSAGIDWVIEYVDEDGEFHKVNDRGMLEPETAELIARGGPVYVKVYPMSYNDSGTVQVSASNADSVRVSQTAPGLFGDATPTPAQAAPVPMMLALLALLVVVLARRG